MIVAMVRLRKMQFYQDTLSYLHGLSLREKWILAAGLLFVSGFILLQFAVIPYFEARAKKISLIERKRGELVEMRQLSDHYRKLKSEENSLQSRLARRDSSFALFSFLDSQAGLAGVKKEIKYMKPSVVEGQDLFDEIIVEMKFEDILLENMVKFLSLVESEQNLVFLNRLSIQSSRKSEGLDVILQAMTYKLRKEQ